MLTVSLFAVAGCGAESTPQVCFTISNNIERRTVDLILDENAGLDVAASDGVFHLQIPRTGVVRLRSLDAFTEPHIQTVAFEGGSTIPVIGTASPVPDRDYWWPLGESKIDGVTTRLVYAIGNSEEIPEIDVFGRDDSDDRAQ